MTLDSNTKTKMIEDGEKKSLSVNRLGENYDVDKTEIYTILRVKSKINENLLKSWIN